MRYSFALSTIIACTLGTKAYGFATRAVPSAARSAPMSYRAVDAASFTSINLFGFGKTVDAPTSTDITEKEVRALFELWNSALATGDSRIVANCYTRVSYVLSLSHADKKTLFNTMHLTLRYKSIIFGAVTSPPSNHLGQTSHGLWICEGLLRWVPIEEASG